MNVEKYFPNSYNKDSREQAETLVNALEITIERQIPSDYKEFLIELETVWINGKNTDPTLSNLVILWVYNQKYNGKSHADALFPIGYGVSLESGKCNAYISNILSTEEIAKQDAPERFMRVPFDFLTIANDGTGNYICIGTSGEYYAHIYFWTAVTLFNPTTQQYDNLLPVTDSFEKFFNGLSRINKDASGQKESDIKRYIKELAKKCDDLRNNDKYTEAETYLDEILEQEPNSSWYWHLAADIYGRLDKYEKAIAAYKKALQIGQSTLDNEAKIYNNLASYSQMNKDLRSAADYIEIALRNRVIKEDGTFGGIKYTNHPFLYSTAADIYADTDNRAKFLEYLELSLIHYHKKNNHPFSVEPAYTKYAEDDEFQYLVDRYIEHKGTPFPISRQAKNKDRKRAEELLEHYGIDFPDDFWRFWEFYNELKTEQIEGFLTDFESLGITLHGPFAVLNGDFDSVKPKYPWHLHWRFFMDPPEFFTVLCGSSDGEHWGYWLDDPAKGNFYVAKYYNNDAYEISNCGNTLFETVRMNLEYGYASSLEDIKMYTRQNKQAEVNYAQEFLKKCDRIRELICKYETGFRTLKGYEYTDAYNGYYADTRNSSFPPFDRIGFVVESRYISDSTYEVPLATPENIKEICTRAEEYIKEGYYGNAMAIGKELFTYGKQFQNETCAILSVCYEKLGRPLLSKILKEHFATRHHTSVDILSWE